MSEYADTNLFIRLLARDDVVKTQRCLTLFQRVRSGEAHLVTSEAIVAEVVYVLSSPATYRLARADVVSLLRPLLEVKGLHLEHKHAILEALDLYEQTSLDFEDCLSVQHMRRLGITSIYSYDHHFDRVAGIQRLEP